MNTKKTGELLENLVGFELGMNKTKGSGQVKHNGDLKDDNTFVVECKVRNKKNLIIDNKWINEVKKQANLSNREWLIINELEDKSIYVTMDFWIFKELYHTFKNSKSTIHNQSL